jgi:hypothetical protein
MNDWGRWVEVGDVRLVIVAKWLSGDDVTVIVVTRGRIPCILCQRRAIFDRKRLEYCHGALVVAPGQ